MENKTKKKLVIKPYREKPKLPVDFEETTWKKLEKAVQAVHTKKPVDHGKEALYRAVEDMCLHKMAPRLYEKLVSLCREHIGHKTKRLITQTSDHEVFLGIVDGIWKDHCDHMITIRNIFLYLDRSYVHQLPHILSIWDMGLDIFRSYLASLPGVESKIVKAMIHTIERERNGESINRAQLKNISRMLSALQIYESRFEKLFLSESERYYKDEGIRIMESTDVPEYLNHVDSRLREESTRVDNYLDQCSKKPLILVVERTLLVPHASDLILKGFDSLMNESRIRDLKSMYILFNRISKIDELCDNFGQYICKKGLDIVKTAGEKEMIDQLLSFMDRLDEIVKEAFLGNSRYTYAMKNAWENFINEGESRPAQLLAKYLDSKLRDEKGTYADTLETLFEKIMTLFRYLHAKDVFEAFYKRDLAKRLLLGKSASFDSEKSMISRLRAECGSGFTTKLEGMFKDVDISNDVMLQYQTYLKDRVDELDEKARKMETVVQVLTTGYWPAYPPMEIKLPFELSVHKDRFQSYYITKYQGRRLSWQHTLGHCILKYYNLCIKDTRELLVSQFQAMVLLCFNDAEKLTFADILDKTDIEGDHLIRTLQSLALSKTRILTKLRKGKDVLRDDEFMYNKKFAQNKYKMRINTIQYKATIEENQKTNDAIFRDRQYQIDAAIVRIMKSRKTLGHQQLVNDLFEQLRFPATMTDLKRRIESLIEREYLERHPSDKETYNYLA